MEFFERQPLSISKQRGKLLFWCFPLQHSNMDLVNCQVSKLFPSCQQGLGTTTNVQCLLHHHCYTEREKETEKAKHVEAESSAHLIWKSCSSSILLYSLTINTYWFEGRFRRRTLKLVSIAFCSFGFGFLLKKKSAPLLWNNYSGWSFTRVPAVWRLKSCHTLTVWALPQLYVSDALPSATCMRMEFRANGCIQTYIIINIGTFLLEWAWASLGLPYSSRPWGDRKFLIKNNNN